MISRCTAVHQNLLNINSYVRQNNNIEGTCQYFACQMYFMCIRFHLLLDTRCSIDTVQDFLIKLGIKPRIFFAISCMGPKKQGFWPRINHSQMKFLNFGSPSGDSPSKIGGHFSNKVVLKLKSSKNAFYKKGALKFFLERFR